MFLSCMATNFNMTLDIKIGSLCIIKVANVVGISALALTTKQVN